MPLSLPSPADVLSAGQFVEDPAAREAHHGSTANGGETENENLDAMFWVDLMNLP